MSRILAIDPSDNVAVALEPAEKGNTLVLPDGRQIKALDAIPFAHKIAVVPLAEGAPVVKYGEVIGLTTRAITVGEHVHIHNMKSQQS